MSYRSNPSNGPRPLPNQRPRPPLRSQQSPEPLTWFSRRVKARYIVGADGVLVEVARDPEHVERAWCIRCLCDPCKCLPVIRDDDPRFPLLGTRPVEDPEDDDEEFEDRDEYPEEREPELPKEWMAGPLVGWRCWILREDVGLLMSVSHGTTWPPGTPMAGDPQQGNHEGVYAMRSRDLLDGSYDSPGRFMVFGKVALWGRVIEHAKGYRAQYGYPLEIDMRTDAEPMPGFPRPRFLDETAEKIRARYGCVVLTGPRERIERHITRD